MLPMRSRIFIASSREGLWAARAVQQELHLNFTPIIWNQGNFGLEGTVIESLIDAVNNFDYGVFILTPDDLAVIRDESQPIPRDNVIFELGLFVGRLGRRNCAIVIPAGGNIRIPTDLLGVNSTAYNPNRPREEAKSTFGPPCTEIRSWIDRTRRNSGLIHLVGPWKSRYQSILEERGKWVHEDMEIDIEAGNLRMMSRNNSLAYDNIAMGSLNNATELVGEWMAEKNPGAKGTFILTLYPSGTILYGHYTGPGETHCREIGRWILTRNNEDDERAKELLLNSEQYLQQHPLILRKPSGQVEV